ncbi:hypothetical protein HGA34_04480 [Candidatus Falkowbacteria bacterium]|nr:hypothetical protein [Candidatus Falkowbacteria bacterium]
MAPGDVYKDDRDIFDRLKEGEGVVIVRTPQGVTTWGAPKNMITECCDLACEKVGALVGRNPESVSVLIRGGVNCSMSENSVICGSCPGL